VISGSAEIWNRTGMDLRWTTRSHPKRAERWGWLRGADVQRSSSARPMRCPSGPRM
jgi:hypothetical protein